MSARVEGGHFVLTGSSGDGVRVHVCVRACMRACVRVCIGYMIHLFLYDFFLSLG